jgi:hypothetical protein
MPLHDAAKRSLRRIQDSASRRATELRCFAALADFGDYEAARRFGRRYGVSSLVFPDARAANLDMLPSWVDPRLGLVVDLGANEGEGDAGFAALHEALVAPGFELFDLSEPDRVGEGPALWADASYARRPAS